MQGGLFQSGIEDFRDNNPDLSEYTIADFEFIVAQIGAYSQPLIFTMDESEYANSIYGGETSSGYYIKGIADLLEDLEYYENSNSWDYPKEVTESNGRIKLELFK